MALLPTSTHRRLPQSVTTHEPMSSLLLPLPPTRTSSSSLPLYLLLHPRRRHLIFSSYFLFLFFFHPSSPLLLLSPPSIHATSSLLSPLRSTPDHLLSRLRSRDLRFGDDLRQLGEVKDEESVLCHPPRVLHHCPCCSTSAPLLRIVDLQSAARSPPLLDYGSARNIPTSRT